MDEIKQLKNTRAGTWGRMRQIVEDAKRDGRAPDEAERKMYDELEAKVNELDAQIDLLERDAKVAAQLAAVQGMEPRASFGQEEREGVALIDVPTERAIEAGRYFRNLIEGRAQSEGVLADGGFLVPRALGSYVIDLARNAMVTRQAGVQVLKLDTNDTRLPKLEKDAQPVWRAENALIPEDGITIGSNVFAPKSAAVLVKASWELMEDSAMFGQVLYSSLQQSGALELDRVVLRGSGTGSEPQGILNTAGVVKTGIAGVKLTYDHLLDEQAALQGVNYTPTGVIYAPRSERQLSGIKGTDNHYVAPPPALVAPRFPTAQVPTNLVSGTRTTDSEVYTGDFTNVIFGLRTDIKVIPLRERFAENGQVGFILWMRGDVQVVRPAAVRVLTEVGTA